MCGRGEAGLVGPVGDLRSGGRTARGWSEAEEVPGEAFESDPGGWPELFESFLAEARGVFLLVSREGITTCKDVVAFDPDRIGWVWVVEPDGPGLLSPRPFHGVEVVRHEPVDVFLDSGSVREVGNDPIIQVSHVPA